MPNHCYNEIQIVSDKGLAPIRKLIVNEKEDAEDAGLIDFNLCVPQPEEVRNSPAMLGREDREKPNWYDWNTENWGTKWNAYQCEIIEDCNGKYTDTLEIRFTTAWGVPDKWVKRLSEKLFEYDADANMCGFYRIEGYEDAGTWHVFNNDGTVDSEGIE